MIKDIEHVAKSFEEHTGIEFHYVGLPYIRTEVNGSVKKELISFRARFTLSTSHKADSRFCRAP